MKWLEGNGAETLKILEGRSSSRARILPLT